MGSGFSKKKKQAKMMQEQVSAMQEKLSSAEFTGEAGNGLVTVTITGDHQLKSIKIKKECVDPEDIEGLEDLILAAFKDANSKASQDSSFPGFSGFPGLGF